jgi:hypothetical protein
MTSSNSGIQTSIPHFKERLLLLLGSNEKYLVQDEADKSTLEMSKHDKRIKEALRTN